MNSKKIITITLLCISTSGFAADLSLCKSELLGANQTLSTGGTLSEDQKKQLMDCFTTPNACANNFPELEYNCHYIHNLVTTVNAPIVIATPAVVTKPAVVAVPTQTVVQTTQPVTTSPTVNPVNNNAPEATPPKTTETPTSTPSSTPNEVNWF